MKKPILVRKQAGGGGIMYTREVGGRGQGGLMEDLAALRGGARGLVTDPNTNNVRQGFIPGAQLGAAKPTGMQRLAAGANIAGRGLAAALTGLQTAYGLQGGNVGALGNIADNYAATVPGLTMNRPTEAQQAQDMATQAFNEQQRQMANDAMMQQATPPKQGNLTVGVAPPTYGSSSATTPAQQPTQPPAGLPAQPPVPAQAPMETTPASAASVLPPLPNAPAPATTAPAPATTAPAPATTAPAPATTAQMLPDVSQDTTTPTEPPANPAMAMFRDVQAAKRARMQGGGTTPPVAVTPPMNQGEATPHQTHEEQRRQVAVRQPVQATYAPQNTVNPFRNPTGQKPGHAYNTNQYAHTEQQHGLSPDVDYRRRGMPAQFDGVSWENSGGQSLGDDENFGDWWEDRNNYTNPLKRAAFVSQVLDEFGDMLHKADPHIAGLLALRVFMDKVMK